MEGSCWVLWVLRCCCWWTLPWCPVLSPEDYVVPFPMPSASTWAWSPSRSGSWSAPPPSSSCCSPSCCWEGAPCPSSASWTSRTPNHARGTRRTSILARQRRWLVWGFHSEARWGLVAVFFQFKHFSGLVCNILLKSKIKAVEKAKVVAQSQAI